MRIILKNMIYIVIQQEFKNHRHQTNLNLSK